MSKNLRSMISMLLVTMFLVAACAPAATPTQAPAAAQPTAAEPTTAAAQPTTAEPDRAASRPAEPTAAAAQPTATTGAAASGGDKVTITWWHISTKDPGLSDWQKMADDYMAAHPNVTIEITVLENEAFKTKLTTVMQSGEAPDIFQSWGGGAMNQQIDAGLLKDITADLDADGGAWRNTFAPGALGVYSYQGKNYGVPWDMGMVGFWYNKDSVRQRPASPLHPPPGLSSSMT